MIWRVFAKKRKTCQIIPSTKFFRNREKTRQITTLPFIEFNGTLWFDEFFLYFQVLIVVVLLALAALAEAQRNNGNRNNNNRNRGNNNRNNRNRGNNNQQTRNRNPVISGGGFRATPANAKDRSGNEVYPGCDGTVCLPKANLCAQRKNKRMRLFFSKNHNAVIAKSFDYI